MALLRRDNGRGRGSSRNDQNVNRHSIADFLGLDKSLITQPVSVAAPLPQVPHDFGGEASWPWNGTSSSEAAQIPRAFLSTGGFPPENSNTYSIYSEGAPAGIDWCEELNSGQISALVSSIESMKLPSAPESACSLVGSGSQSISLSHDHLEKAVGNRPWPPEKAAISAADKRATYLARRASFGGSTSVGRNCNSRHDETNLVWNGILPKRCSDPAGGFSAKVFLGGLPWDIGEQALMQTLKAFHPIRVEWPGRDNGGLSPRGYAYVTFENEKRVRALLSASRCDGRDWYYRITSRKMRNKEVQVIPWAVSDSNWVCGGSARLEPSRTVFVGALHGMVTAAGLATIMNDLFHGVLYAGIDTDKNKYPIGSGRVTFNNVRSYVRAISAAFIEIRTAKFTKKVQIDPYLEDSMCSVCKIHQGPYFCREPTCFGYFCRTCWILSHSNDAHKPLTRNSKSSTQYLHSYMQTQNKAMLLGTQSPPGASGDSTNSATSGGTSGTREPQPCIALEAEPIGLFNG